MDSAYQFEAYYNSKPKYVYLTREQRHDLKKEMKPSVYGYHILYPGTLKDMINGLEIKIIEEQ